MINKISLTLDDISAFTLELRHNYIPLLLRSTDSLILMVCHVAVVGFVTQNPTGCPDFSFDLNPPFVFAA